MQGTEITMLHYYCSQRNSHLLDNICTDVGIECSVITDISDIRTVAQNARSFSHINCIVIDVSGFINSPEEIRDAVYAIIMMRGEIPIILVDLEDTEDSETVKQYRSYGFDKIFCRGDAISAMYRLFGTKSDSVGSVEVDNAAVYQTGDYEMPEQNESTIQSKLDSTKPFHRERVGVSDDLESVSRNELTSQNKRIENTNGKMGLLHQLTSASSGKQWRKQKGTGDKKRTNSIKNQQPKKQPVMISICGLQKHIGTTHHAIALVKFLIDSGFTACYINANSDDVVSDTKKYVVSNANQDRIVCCNIPMYYRSTSLMRIIAEKYQFCVFDCGWMEAVSERDFYNKDIRVIVSGTKPWEISKFDALYKQTSLYGIKAILSFVDDDMRQYIEKMYHNEAILFAEYAPNPFVDTANKPVYQAIIQEMME